MRRELDAFDRPFDVAVVGGGVHGACIARLASLSGLSVALVEAGDFCGATSRNSAKLLHGGLRYIQHFDVARIRDSVLAQRAWFRFAPHLVRPLRFVIPAYGWGTRGPAAMGAGALAFHLLAPDRNAGVTAAQRLPFSGVLLRDRLRREFPLLDRADVTGGLWWYDGQMLDAGRLVIECLHDAVAAGAVVANHLRCVALRRGTSGIDGISVRDELTGREREIRARVTVDATGPWSARIPGAPGPAGGGHWTLNTNLVTRQLLPRAVGFASERPSDAAIGKSRRLFFASPWHGCTIIGTTHERWEGEPDTARINTANVSAFVDEVAAAAPELGLRAADVRSVHVGLTPAEDGESLRAKRSLVADHAQDGVAPGLISVVGIKFTTAPRVAELALDVIRRRLGATRKLLAFGRAAEAAPAVPSPLPRDSATEFDERAWTTRVYGTRAPEVLALVEPGESDMEALFRCRVRLGVAREQVMRLGDAVFRATDWAERGLLDEGQLTWAARLLSSVHGWSDERRIAELRLVKERLTGHAITLQSCAPTGQTRNLRHSEVY